MAVGQVLIDGIEEIWEIIILNRSGRTNEFREKKRMNMKKFGLTHICKKLYFD